MPTCRPSTPAVRLPSPETGTIVATIVSAVVCVVFPAPSRAMTVTWQEASGLTSPGADQVATSPGSAEPGASLSAAARPSHSIESVASASPATASLASQPTSMGMAVAARGLGATVSGLRGDRVRPCSQQPEAQSDGRRGNLRPARVKGDAVAEDGRLQAGPVAQLHVQGVAALSGAELRARRAADGRPA